MSIGRGRLHTEHGPIERAQAHGMLNVIKCEVRLASPNSQPATKIPRLRQVGIDRETPIDESRSVVELMGYKGESISTHAQRYRVISTQMHCFPGQPRSFGTFLRMLDPATRLALHVAPRGHAIGAGQTRVELDRPAKELQRLAVRVPGPPMSARQPTQVIVVCIQIFGWFALGPLDLRMLQLRRDGTHDAGSHVVL